MLALGMFAVVFLTSGGHIATDRTKTAAGGVYALPDCGSSGWQQGGGTDELLIYSLASHGGSPNVYAGLWGDGVYRSPSGQNSWSLTSLMAPLEITSLAIDPASPATMVYAGARGGIYRSDNGSASWRAPALEGKDVWSLALTSTAHPVYAYAGTAGEIYTTTNGVDWNLAGGTEIGTDRFYALAVDPQDSKIAYVGTREGGVFRTANGGMSWTASGLFPMTIRALAVRPDDSRVIFAGTQSDGQGIFKSTDGGGSWPVNTLVGHDVLAIAINPRNPEFVYAGTFGGGVWVSYNGGQDWSSMSGLTDGAAFIYSLTLFTPEGDDGCQVLYAGTTDGVWDRTVTSFYTLYLPLVDKG
jgi:photosystem II stability/assembly factor-like uncharacterized protein